MSLPKTLTACKLRAFSGNNVGGLRTLTKPCEPAVPGGYDNLNDDLIVSVNDVFVSTLGYR